MAVLLPPHGSTPVSIVFTKEEALVVLAVMTRNPTGGANAEVRRALSEYVNRLKMNE